MTIGDQTRGPRALADCNLDASGLGAQLERYRQLGREATTVARLPGRVVVRFASESTAGLLKRTLEMERGCCPFVHTAYEGEDRRLTMTAETPDQDPRLESLFHTIAQAQPQTSSSCCAPSRLATCCEPENKAACCGDTHDSAPARCGCTE